MTYTPESKNDFDRTFRFEQQRFSCYSRQKMQEVSESPCIIGIARADRAGEHSTLHLGRSRMSVTLGHTNEGLYKTVGYVPVGKDRYIAIQLSRRPGNAYMTFMCTAAMACCMGLCIIQNLPLPQTAAAATIGEAEEITEPALSDLCTSEELPI